MEAPLQRPTHDHHHYEEDPPNIAVTEGDQGEHNHQAEKKSVLKKVKDKAKKIKDTIKKPGGHGLEHEYRHDQISEGEDDEDEEMVNAPNVHGAPMNESAFITGTTLPKQTGLDLEKPTGVPGDRFNPNARNIDMYPDVGDGRGVTKTSSPLDDSYNSNVRNEAYPDVGDGRVLTKTDGLSEDRHNPNIRNEVYPDIGDSGVTSRALHGDQQDPIVKNEESPDVGDGVTRTSDLTELERSRLEAEPPKRELNNPLATGPAAVDLEEASVAEPMVKIGPLVDLEEDPHSPKNRPGRIPPSNYQAKVVDPTGEGGKEAEVAPLVRRLDNLHVHDESESNVGSEQRPYAGSHDQFAPQSTPTDEQLNPESNPIGESPKTFDPAKPESMPRDTIAGKISSTTSAIADKAASAKNVVASKLGYGSQHQEGQDSSKKALSESATGYGHKIAEKLAPVYEKVAGAGSAIMSKVQRRGGAEREGGDSVAKQTDKGVSVKEYLAEKFSPGDEDKALSGAITDAIHKKKEGILRREEGQPIERVKESEDVAHA